jgi:hypothetical protein
MRDQKPKKGRVMRDQNQKDREYHNINSLKQIKISFINIPLHFQMLHKL